MTPQLIIGALVVLVFIASQGLHKVDEGYVGVYWRGGALLNTFSNPGFQLKVPFITSVSQVQTSVQTDRVRDIPCGTSGGVLVTFESIEVVNRLHPDAVIETIRKYSVDYDKIWIFDKIHHEINQFCSSHTLQEVYIDMFDTLDESLASALQRDLDTWAPGIEIIATRVTKPRLPKNIARDYETMEEEKTKLLISTAAQQKIQKEAETEQLRAMIEAEKEAAVSAIKSQQSLLEKQAYQNIELIEDEINTSREKALADAAFYKKQKKAQANALKMTSEYLAHQSYTHMKAQPKVFMESDLGHILEAYQTDGSE